MAATVATESAVDEVDASHDVLRAPTMVVDDVDYTDIDTHEINPSSTAPLSSTTVDTDTPEITTDTPEITTNSIASRRVPPQSIPNSTPADNDAPAIVPHSTASQSASVSQSSVTGSRRAEKSSKGMSVTSKYSKDRAETTIAKGTKAVTTAETTPTAPPSTSATTPTAPPIAPPTTSAAVPTTAIATLVSTTHNKTKTAPTVASEEEDIDLNVCSM